jgi:hypothetical protein
MKAAVTTLWLALPAWLRGGLVAVLRLDNQREPLRQLNSLCLGH